MNDDDDKKKKFRLSIQMVDIIVAILTITICILVSVIIIRQSPSANPELRTKILTGLLGAMLGIVSLYVTSRIRNKND